MGGKRGGKEGISLNVKLKVKYKMHFEPVKYLCLYLQSVPGPGRYDIKSNFEPEGKKINQEGVEVEHPPFLSQSRRFGAVKNPVPAPGAYNDPRTALDSLKKITGLKRSPFGQTAVRFGPTHHTRKTPGKLYSTHLLQMYAMYAK